MKRSVIHNIGNNDDGNNNNIRSVTAEEETLAAAAYTRGNVLKTVFIYFMLRTGIKTKKNSKNPRAPFIISYAYKEISVCTVLWTAMIVSALCVLIEWKQKHLNFAPRVTTENYTYNNAIHSRILLL